MTAAVRNGTPWRIWRSLVTALVFVASLATVVLALGKDKALYVGGTLRDFPRGGLGEQIRPNVFTGADVAKIEGKIDAKSEFELVFDAGGKGTLAIPYSAVMAVAYGLDPHGLPQGGIFLITWDPLDQYTAKAHYLLSIRYLDQSGAEQGVVFELGKDIVRTTLATLEARTGKSVEFTNVDACMQYKTAEACGRGAPVELRGLTAVFVDAGDYRDLISAAIESAALSLQLLPDSEGAEIVLRFRGGEFHRPGYLQTLHGGRGEAFVVREGQLRPVVVFAGTRMRAWGDKPATKFAAAFVEAYREANRH